MEKIEKEKWKNKGKRYCKKESVKLEGESEKEVNYQYNELGQRVSRKDITGSDLPADRQANIEYYIHDGVNIVADLDEDKELLRSYTYAPGYDNIVSMTTYGDSETNTYFYIQNNNNSVVALVDEAGDVAESYEYSAYGVVTVFDSNGNELDESALGNRYTFQGREIDWSTGLYNFRARWYDPDTGRWLSKDPIGINGGLNQYVFCGNNPVMFGDPEGLTVVFIGKYASGGGCVGGNVSGGIVVSWTFKKGWEVGSYATGGGGSYMGGGGSAGTEWSVMPFGGFDEASGITLEGGGSGTIPIIGPLGFSLGGAFNIPENLSNWRNSILTFNFGPGVGTPGEVHVFNNKTLIVPWDIKHIWNKVKTWF